VSAAVRETGRIIETTLTYIGRLVRGRESADQLSGVVGMAQVSGAVVSSDGLFALVPLTALISVSIGLFNLFPIPMLDGGHLLFYAIEAVRGRPLSPRIQDLGFRIGFALVIMLFIFVTFNDIANLSGIFSSS
jgi:regulator of sigma E protease